MSGRPPTSPGATPPTSPGATPPTSPGATLARIAGVLVAEATRARRLRLPAPADLDAAWLTRALCRDVPGARVLAVARRDATRGTTTRARLTLTLNPTAEAAGLPTRLFAKGTPGLAQRLMLGAGGFAGSEAQFYAHVRPQLDIEAPKAHHVAFDPRTWRSLVLVEDVVATRHARFTTDPAAAPTTTLTPDEVADGLATAARWHGTLQGDPRLAGAWAWLRTPGEHMRLIDGLIRLADRLPAGFARGAEVMPASVARRQPDLLAAMRRAMPALSAPPHTYLHGDLHVANLYRTAAGTIGVADWQVGLKGGWAFDVAYLIATALTPEDRRAHERALLAGYLDRLAAAGARPDPEAAWDAYRAGLIYPLFAWLYTLGAARLQPSFQPRDRSLTLVQRIAVAVEDLDAFAAIGL